MKKNILVVDDSALVRRTLCDIINTDDKYEVTDYCRDGEEALNRLRTHHYDAVLLDVNMPKMSGIELLEALKKEKIEVTVVMASTETKEGAQVTLRCMELGAVDFITKPENIIEAKGITFKKKLIDILDGVLFTQEYKKTSHEAVVPRVRTEIKTAGKKKLVAVACSTGGPKSLQSVIPYLDPKLNAPVVLVQHMPPGFTKSLSDRLNEMSKVDVKEADEGDVLTNGCVYIAPGGKHMQVVTDKNGVNKIHLNDDPPVGTLKPCADIMYESIKTTTYDEIVCVVLTGMGADGTKGIVSLDKSKPVYCISQDADSCVVYGMPKAIADAHMSDVIVPLDKVANTINKYVGVK